MWQIFDLYKKYKKNTQKRHLRTKLLLSFRKSVAVWFSGDDVAHISEGTYTPGAVSTGMGDCSRVRLAFGI